MSNSVNQKSEIKNIFRGNLAGLVSVCKPLKSFIPNWMLLWSLLPSSIFIVLLLVLSSSSKTVFLLFNYFISSGLTYVAVQLSLSLGGFILIVSYGNQNFIERVVCLQVKKFDEKSKLEYNYLQKTIGNYAFIVLFQFFVLIVFAVLAICSKVNIPISSNLELVINYMSIFIVTSLFLYITCLTCQLILNLFTLSQSSSFQLFLEKKIELEDEKKLKKLENSETCPHCGKPK